MFIKSPFHFVLLTHKFVYSKETKIKYRKKSIYFTRERKMPFVFVVLFMLNLLRKSLPLEIHSFYSKLKKKFDKVTSSAFIQNRHKIKPDLFYDLNKLISSDFYVDNDQSVKLYKNYRLLSIDGSKIHLPISEDTVENFGYYNNQKETNHIVLARVSVLYDVLNNMVLDGLLSNIKKGEVTLCRQHLSFVQKKDLLLLDRNYPSFQTCFLILQRQADFVMRCKVNFNNEISKFYESGKKEAIVEIRPNQNSTFKDLPYDKTASIKVRLIRIVLSSGEIEILMTSLTDKKQHPIKQFKELYFKRWGIETYYDRFKNIIEVEKFSGKSTEFIQQEFNCALYISNMQTIFTNDVAVQKEIKEKYKKRKHDYKVNQSLSLGIMREKILNIFIEPKKSDDKQYKELKDFFINNVIPIRPNRKYERDTKKYSSKKKPKQFGNRRAVH